MLNIYKNNTPEINYRRSSSQANYKPKNKYKYSVPLKIQKQKVQEHFSICSSRLKPLLDKSYEKQNWQMKGIQTCGKHIMKSQSKPVRSSSLEYLSFQLKINKNIANQMQKIQNLKKRLQSATKNKQLIGKQQKKDGNKSKLYKSATASPYITRQKQKICKIKQFNRLLSANVSHSQQYTQKQKPQQLLATVAQQTFEYCQNSNKFIKRRYQKMTMDGIQITGQKPKWKQFQSWRRMRYKITIKGYNDKNKADKKIL